MSLQSAPIQVVYPESDGKPRRETDLHRDWMVRIIDLLKHVVGLLACCVLFA